MKFIGYESYTSWIVTIGTCIIHCTSQTPYRIAGLMYVSIVEYFETDRETASIPIMIFIIVRCLGGPFCGVLGEKFSHENITIYGSIIAAIGFGGCFLAHNITGLSISLGIIFGIGMTGSNTFLPTIVKKYFNKNLNSANGISQAGSCLGAILIPPLAVYLLDKYGLPGTFLIVSALMLHAVPISLMIRKAGLIQDKIIEAVKRNKFVLEEKLQTNNQKSSLDSGNNISEKIFIDNKTSLPDSANEMSEQTHINNQSFPPDSATNLSLQMSIRNRNSPSVSATEITEMSVNNQKPDSGLEDANIPEKLSISNQKSLPDSVNINISDQLSIDNKKSSHSGDANIPEKLSISNQKSISDSIDINISEQHTIDNKKSLSESEDVTIPEHLSINNHKSLPDSVTCVIVPVKNYPETTAISNASHNLKLEKKSKFALAEVFLNLPFLIILFCTGIHNYVSVLLWTTMIDYSRDKGIPRYYEVYFLMVHPFCEIIGRVSFGWVTDLGYLTMSKYSTICFTLMGLTCGCVLWSADFWTMMLGALTYAISCGAMTAIFPGMVFSFVPEELHSMAIASRHALSGPLIFTSAPLIGLFRENNGSYDGIYYLLIAVCIFCAAIMPLLDRVSKRDKKVLT